MPADRRPKHFRASFVCLDIGAALLDIAQRKLAAYPNVQFQHADFETWAADAQRFDLVMSAIAFHWVAPDVGYPKAAAVLKKSGSICVCSTRTRPTGVSTRIHAESSSARSPIASTTGMAVP